MPSISENINRLAKLRRTAGPSVGMPESGRLQELAGFGSNPGMLKARQYVPASMNDRAPLVVVLHGCTQTANGYDTGSGWSQLADRYGFALLFPEQQRPNNPNLCFKWFSPEDNRRDKGEALSIRQMISAMIDLHGLDPTRVFVTGLSAGGAMASIMLASYPELFAGGAIIAGLPYGSANSIPQAFEAMRAVPSNAALSKLVRSGSEHAGPWPTISIWHGSADATVHPANAGAVLDQWRAVHQLEPQPTRVETVDGYPRRVWCDANGRELIEEFSITGMSHGTPLATKGPDGHGKSGPFMLEASISSTLHICRFWGLTDNPVAMGGEAEEAPAAHNRTDPVSIAVPTYAEPENASRAGTDHAPTGVGKVIEDALRAAGLMR